MAESPTGMERRMVHRLLVHWRNSRQEEKTPSLDDIFRQDLDDIVPLTYVLKVPDGGGEPEYERIGDSFSGELSEDLVGRPVSQTPEGTLLSQAVRYYDKVLGRKVPITLGGEFTHARGDTILYRSIILPVSGGSGTVDRLLGAANCKVKE